MRRTTLLMLFVLVFVFVSPAQAADYGTMELGEDDYYFWMWEMNRGDVIAYSFQPSFENYYVNVYITTQTEFERFKEGQDYFQYESDLMTNNPEGNHGTFRVVHDGAWVLILLNNYSHTEVDYVVSILTPTGEICPSAVPPVTETVTETAPPVTITETTYTTETTTNKTMSEFAIPAILGLTLFVVLISIYKRRRN